MQSSGSSVETTLVRVSARAWGIATGLLLGTGVFVATAILVIKGGEDVGSHLGRLGAVFPGYDVTWVGSLVGFVYAFVVGYALGRLLAPRRPLERSAQGTLGRHLRLNGNAWGWAIGLLLGLGLFGATNVLVVRGGDHPGELLSHLAVWLPGYSVTFVGSLIGLIWLVVLGNVVGRAIGGVYNRAVERAEA